MPQENGAGADSADASPKPAGPSFSPDNTIRAAFPKPEEIWVYHTLAYVTGATHAVCPLCRMQVPVEVAKLNGKPVQNTWQVFLPIYTRAGVEARSKRPRSPFIVRCVPHDARMDCLKIPDFLAEVDITQRCLTGRHQ